MVMEIYRLSEKTFQVEYQPLDSKHIYIYIYIYIYYVAMVTAGLYIAYTPHQYST